MFSLPLQFIFLCSEALYKVSKLFISELFFFSVFSVLELDIQIEINIQMLSLHVII